MRAALDKIRGCLLGGAAGDALGYPVEFISARGMKVRYGEEGITEYSLRQGIAVISDDTQMSLFTANGLLCAETRAALGGRAQNVPDTVFAAYLDWYRSQTCAHPLPDVHWAESHVSWLLDVPELFSRRAPGNTCMSALADMVPGSTRRPINESKGCGGVMRVAPVGLWYEDAGEAALAAAECAALTHGHELGWLPAALLAHMVCTLSHGDASPRRALALGLEAMPGLFPEAKELPRFLTLMEQAADFAAHGGQPQRTIRRLGGGWVGDEALAIAVYCALKYPSDIEAALIAAVNHDGDSDSTGAVAGNILGASLGASAIPDKFLERLELRDVIEELAADMHRGFRANDPAWRRKYVEMHRE